MNIQIFVGVISLFYSLIGFSLEEKTLVKIPQGILQGTIVSTKNGRSISSFQGIPYGQPPIKELRFSRPLPAKAWNGVYLANKIPNSCPQLNTFEEVVGHEDCLYLNVFTPLLNFNPRRINGTVKNRLLPVMVWIHGGGFVGGNSSAYGPTYLLDKDIILVSMNYRVGIFGFLTTGDSVAPGNFALKDQLLALKWVQKNIRFFGGDPDRVTLFGESAGGATVHFHTLSKATDGLFRQYIIQSGTASGPWAFRSRNYYKPLINKIGEKLGCSTVSSAVLIKCLRELSVKKLLTSISNSNVNFPVIAWIPTDELESEDAFLTDSPMNLLARNEMKDYPFMSGTVVDEGLLVTHEFYKSSATLETVRNYLEMCIDNLSKYYLASGDQSRFKTLIKDYYFGDSTTSTNASELLVNYTKLVSDSGFLYPELHLLENIAKVAKSPFYFYSFGYLGNLSMWTEDDKDKNIGVPHGAELYYLFPRGRTNSMTQEDERVIHIMVDLWTSFAINRKPTSVHLKDPNFWLPYTENRSFLQIGNIANNTDSSVTLENNYFTNRMNFWKDLVPVRN